VRRLPPTGNRIAVDQTKYIPGSVEGLFAPFDVRLYQSGTAALAAAVVAAVSMVGRRQPEVLLPAYGCPDLVSAVLYAGATPVLVDLADGVAGLDQQQLREKIGARTVAVIAVNFLGLDDDLAELRRLADTHGIMLIEDNAQCLVDPGEGETPHGDFIIQSFGRGKPVSLLGGGAVLARDVALSERLPRPAAMAGSPRVQRALNRLKIHLYNAALSPGIYGLIDRIPFLHIGTTTFRPLDEIAAAGPWVAQRLRANVMAFRQREPQAQKWIAEMLRRLDMPGITDLAATKGGNRQIRLLRYPLLFRDPARRDRVLRDLGAHGLGASGMYPAPLTDIAGLQGIFRGAGHFPHAANFARTLLTLPTHEGVGAEDVKAMEMIMRASLSAD
jgi:dTDP-4-amino-4,6-dideoxygalactose transaminase